MKESPIIMSTPMVKAILDNRKTMTRRIFKDHPTLASDLSKIDLKQWFQDHKDYMLSFSPYGSVGDLLYVRESFAIVTSKIQTHPIKIFKADYPESIDDLTQYMNKNDCKWKPSIHMPKSAARIWLEITDIKPERLHDISHEDCRKEGIEQIGATYKDYLLAYTSTYNERISFQTLWILINGVESWNKNPWVWAIDFKVLSTTGREAVTF